MRQRTEGFQINPSEQTIDLGPLRVRFLITAADSAGSAAVFELFVPGSKRLPGPSHSHDHYEETIYGLEGVLSWTVNGNPIDVGPGQALCIPRGAVHRFDNNQPVDAKALCVITPAEIGPQYFHEVGEALSASPRRPPDPAKIAEIMCRHGLTPAPGVV